MKHLVLLLLIAAIPAACAGDWLRLEDSLDAMGTAYSIVAYGPERGILLSAREAAFDEVRRLDRLLSNYRQESEWSQVNRFAASRPVEVSQELFDLLAACVEYSRKSEGSFDISVGPLMKIWGFYKGSGRLPHRAEIRGALARVGYRNLLLDPAKRTVKFARSGVEIDPGGIGKGYAVDRMVAVLRERGIVSALVSAGGSSIYGLGAPPKENGWTLKIRNPKDARESVETVVLKDMSMSTSGNYEKFFWAEGKLYSHIMDPRTGFPAAGMLSVSVIAPKTLDSEAWTKPVYILGRRWASQNLPKGLRAYLCEAKDGVWGENRAGFTCAWLQ